MYSLDQRIKHYWKRICEFEGVPEYTIFVVISARNPYSETYTRLVRARLRY